MRSARVELGSGGGSSGFNRCFDSIPGEVRVRFFLNQKRQRTTATQIPGEKLKIALQKNPSVATSKRFHRARLTTAKTSSSRKHVVSLSLALASPACCSRGQVYKLLRQFIKGIATPQPTVNPRNTLILYGGERRPRPQPEAAWCRTVAL
jgi:hypothetical protein